MIRELQKLLSFYIFSKQEIINLEQRLEFLVGEQNRLKNLENKMKQKFAEELDKIGGINDIQTEINNIPCRLHIDEDGSRVYLINKCDLDKKSITSWLEEMSNYQLFNSVTHIIIVLPERRKNTKYVKEILEGTIK